MGRRARPGEVVMSTQGSPIISTGEDSQPALSITLGKQRVRLRLIISRKYRDNNSTSSTLDGFAVDQHHAADGREQSANRRHERRHASATALHPQQAVVTPQLQPSARRKAVAPHRFLRV